MKRGKPKGSVAPFSLTAKLSAMDVGDILIFPDKTCPSGRQTHMASALTTYTKRMAALKDKQFSGQRAVVVGADLQTQQAMIVTRTK